MKRLIIFSLILAIGLAILGVNQSIESCYALSNAFIDVIGSAKKEVAPNVANIRFGINAISEDVREGQNKINTIIEDIEKSICENNYGDCELIVEYSSCYPKFNNGITNYYFNTNVIAKTSDITKVNELIAVACDNGATSYYNVSYELDNYEDIYQEVLLLPKDNAYKKASGINSDISQVGFKEMSLFNYCNDSKIIVEANIRARYEVLNSDLSQNEDNIHNEDLNNNIVDNNEIDDSNINKEDYFEGENKNLIDDYQIPEIHEENNNSSVVNNDQLEPIEDDVDELKSLDDNSKLENQENEVEKFNDEINDEMKNNDLNNDVTNIDSTMSSNNIEDNSSDVTETNNNIENNTQSEIQSESNNDYYNAEQNSDELLENKLLDSNDN